MNVYQRLMTARLRLQSVSLKKSGRNAYAGYDYFELGDFLPTVQEIFFECGLCGVVSYEEDKASLTIVDIETGEKIVITSPMGSAALKGCHDVQNIGAVETYQRRYLWVTAMEIVEHDEIDSATNKEKKSVKGKEEQEAFEAELLDKAADAAGKGTAAYKDFWTGLRPAQKQIIGERRHSDFKLLAEEIGAQA